MRPQEHLKSPDYEDLTRRGSTTNQRQMRERHTHPPSGCCHGCGGVEQRSMKGLWKIPSRSVPTFREMDVGGLEGQCQADTEIPSGFIPAPESGRPASFCLPFPAYS
jgi:hypothetical protein